MIFFFFSSRRRHTRLTCDWSSDVCSSDLRRRQQRRTGAHAPGRRGRCQVSGRVTRRRARLLAGVVAVVAVIVVLLMTGLGKDPSVIASPLVGRAAPNFTLPQLDGPPVTLAKLRGQIVVINFWASWCTECQVEQAALDQAWRRFRDSGVV